MSESRRVLAVVALTVIGATACADPPPNGTPSAVEIRIEVESGQTWSAAGDSVTSGSICEGGSHRWVGYRQQDGSSIDYDEGAALKGTEPVFVLIETQLDCTDGTGAVSIAWDPEKVARWMVVGGTGAYSGTTGGGSVQLGDERSEEWVTLTGEISSG